ncbi:hypothetical protein V8F06_013219 [Rhypophila decipiens]
MASPALPQSPHPRDLEDVELSDLSTRITSATAAHGPEPERPSSETSDVDHNADLDPISSSYYQILKHYGTIKARGQGAEYQLLWSSLAPRAKDEEVRCRAVIADLSRRQAPKFTPCQSSERLAEVLEDTESREPGSARLILLEDLSLDHICVVGSRLRIHPSVFARHFIHLRFTSLHSENMATFLASNIPSPSNGVGSAPRYFMLRYFDIIPKDPGSFEKASPHQSWLRRHKGFPNYDFAIFKVLRRVFIPPKNGDWDVDGEVVTVQSKISVWKDPTSKQIVVLVDPTIRDPKLVQILSSATSSDSTPFQIHFADIFPQPLTAPIDLEQLESPPTGPSSHSLLDDTQATLSSQALDSPTGDPAETLLVFLRQYVISKWFTYLNHVHRCLVSVRDKQSVRSMQPDGGWSEDMFVGIKYWSEYLPMVQLTIEANMAALGITDSSFNHGSPQTARAPPFDDDSKAPSTMDDAKMWRYIHRMLGNYAKMFERVADSYTQVVAIKEAQSSTIQAQASATQAQFVGRLTFLGTLFLPASLVAGVLSMGGDFLPGQRLFWVYIAVLIPVLLLVILVLFTDLGTIFIPDPSFKGTKRKEWWPGWTRVVFSKWNLSFFTQLRDLF